MAAADAGRERPGQPAGVPSDNTTLQEVLRRFAADGWSADLWLVEAPDDTPARVLCGRCGRQSDPQEVPVSAVRRMEGASDPADMLAVLALTCPHCGARGTLVTHYGPEATVHQSALLRTIGIEADLRGGPAG